MQLVSKIILQCDNDDPLIYTELNSKCEAFCCKKDLKSVTYDLKTGENRIAVLKNDLYVTDIDPVPSVLDTSGRKRPSDILLLGTADGKCILLHKGGKIERSVDCHRGAVLCCRWNHDGTNFISCGEDGMIKIWSRSCMLRATVASISTPVYSGSWGPLSSNLIYTAGKALVIQSTSQATKHTQWKAHEGIVLKVAWNAALNLIASAGEDCKIKIWDPQGQLLVSSPTLLHPVSALTFSPDGQYLACAAFSSVLLINCLTGTHKTTSFADGGISSLNWGLGSSQLIIGNNTGKVEILHLVGMSSRWKHYEASISSPKTVKVVEILHDVSEVLEYQEDVLKFSIKFGNLVVNCGKQIFVHKANAWTNSVTVNLRENNADLILQAEKHFLVTDGGLCFVYSYEGSLQSTFKYQTNKATNVTSSTVSVSNNLVAAVSHADSRALNFWDVRTGRSYERPFVHSSSIVAVELDPSSGVAGERAAFVDNSRDLYLLNATSLGNKNSSPIKIAAGVTSFCWSVDCCMLAFTKQDELVIILYPPAFSNEIGVSAECAHRYNLTEYGNNVILDSLYSKHVNLKRGDAVFTLAVPHCFSLLQEHVSSGKWDLAMRLCSSEKVRSLWACLAAMAIQGKQFDAAQAAYAAICEPDKVLLIESIKKPKSTAIGKSEMALLSNNRTEAESILLQSGLTFRAIMLNISLFQFERALELAVKFNSNIDTVIAHRQRYLEYIGLPESHSRFIEFYRKVDIDWDAIEERISAEFSGEILLAN